MSAIGVYAILFEMYPRGTYLADKNNGDASPSAGEQEEDVTTEGVPVKFRHDPRLVLPTFQYHTPDQVQSYIDGIAVKTLLIIGGRSCW